MRRSTALAAIVLGLLVAFGATPAMAADPSDREVDPAVAAMLEEVPGGIVIDATRAVWPDLGMELQIVGASSISARTVGGCATGKTCAFSLASLGGSILSFSSCTVNAVPASFVTRSAANARTSGYMQARNGSSVLATIYAGNWSNVSGTVTNLRCVL
ncbi:MULTISPECIES: hypothetical protein [unclassified Microbacterium]|uniref:hypothetical protein n=1 Tax=unclassified Microbacterium TaxID=2609290 RepID=UPI000492F8EB|nr:MULTISPECIES: hypothetical protein [unclassified Microbacterium]